MTALLQVEGLGKRFGGFVALDGIQLEVKEGERLGLIEIVVARHRERAALPSRGRAAAEMAGLRAEDDRGWA